MIPQPLHAELMEVADNLRDATEPADLFRCLTDLRRITGQVAASAYAAYRAETDDEARQDEH